MALDGLKMKGNNGWSSKFSLENAKTSHQCKRNARIITNIEMYLLQNIVCIEVCIL
jgi:hypothetical protein